jgi:hypothetical protein
MGRLLTRRLRGVLLVGGVLVGACAPGDYEGTPLEGGLATDGGGVTIPAGTCSPAKADGPTVPVLDPASYPACCAKGAARCVPEGALVPSLKGRLEACSGGFCEPESFLRDPARLPPSCTSIGSAPGVCLSVCLPEVAANAGVLPKATCADDEACVPCISPLDGKSTGACPDAPSPRSCDPSADGGGPTTGGLPADATVKCPYVGPPLVDLGTLPGCAPGAHCLGEALVPAAQKSQLAACPGGLCVPDTFIVTGGNFIPASCRAYGDLEGRCLGEALKSVARDKDKLSTEGCAAFERCVPCYDPLSGTDTGSCRLGCDPGPREPAAVFGSCCSLPAATTPQGRCIPGALLSKTEQGNLDVKDCADKTAFCVPKETLGTPPVPVPCTATAPLSGSYSGVCVSACVKAAGLKGIAVDQGTCDGLHICAPCIDPITKRPTGAPGCP